MWVGGGEGGGTSLATVVNRDLGHDVWSFEYLVWDHEDLMRLWGNVMERHARVSDGVSVGVSVRVCL